MKGVKEISSGCRGCGVKGMMVDPEACGNIRVERERMMAQEKKEGPKEHTWRC